MSGGPTRYDGPELYVAHASMHINDLSYTQMMNLYVEVLQAVETVDELTKELDRCKHIDCMIVMIYHFV